MTSKHKKTYAQPICPNCKNGMRLDDIDYNFDGCQDEYWLCNDCEITAYVKVRYANVVVIEYFNTWGEVIKKEKPCNEFK